MGATVSEVVVSKQGQRGAVFGPVVKLHGVASGDSSDPASVLQDSAPRQDPPYAHVVDPGADEVSGISSTGAFLEFLRNVQKRSSLNPGQIAAVSGIPRTSVYAMVRPDRLHLPRKQTQLVCFLRACHLPEPQVQDVLSVWRRLHAASSGAIASSTRT